MMLVGQFDSPFVRRVAIALHHYGHPFERQVLSVFRDFDAVLAINPMVKVPSLILDDGDTLFDSRTIIDYLDEMAPPERRLAPPNSLKGDASSRLRLWVSLWPRRFMSAGSSTTDGRRD